MAREKQESANNELEGGGGKKNEGSAPLRQSWKAKQKESLFAEMGGGN